MECKVNLSVSLITPTEFNKTKFELSDQTAAFILVKKLQVEYLKKKELNSFDVTYVK